MIDQWINLVLQRNFENISSYLMILLLFIIAFLVLGSFGFIISSCKIVVISINTTHSYGIIQNKMKICTPSINYNIVGLWRKDYHLPDYQLVDDETNDINTIEEVVS
eukprot:371622_1